MIARLVALGAAVAAAASAAVWAKRKADENEDEALEQEIFDAAEERAQSEPVGDVPAGADPAADDLTEIKGIGAVSAERLKDIDVTTFAEIAAWSDDDLEATGAKIKVSSERIRREDWVGQARARTEA